MDVFLMTIIIGISLSMDAFSLALVYGMQKLSYKEKVKLSIIVGAYHFFMPLIGLKIGKTITNYLIVDLDLIVAIIFIVIGLEMIISSIKDKEEKVLISTIGFLIFGLSVSIDSLTTGIGLNIINNNYLQVSTIFALISAFFTYFGLSLGNKFNNKLGNYSTLIGGFILIILGIFYII